ncbi:MAG: hypothetical protein VX438_10760 [Planctomycetota bacterium]|nr:hypothetical protein [Planctomycetota bacterium]
MKKIGCFIGLCTLFLTIGLVGCDAGVEGKGAIKEKETTSPEMQKIIDDMQSNPGKQGFEGRNIPNQD